MLSLGSRWSRQTWCGWLSVVLLYLVIWAGPAMATNSAITVKTMVELDDDIAGEDIHLVGLVVAKASAASTDPGDVGMGDEVEGNAGADVDVDATAVDKGGLVLAVAWQADTAAWFPTWKLVLITAVQDGRESGEGWRTRTAADLGLSATPPIPGHRYEAALGFDADLGVVSVSVKDLTTGERVYAGAHPLPSLAGLPALTGGYPLELHPLPASIQTASPAVARAEVQAVISQYVPVAVDWQPGVKSMDGQFLAVRGFDGALGASQPGGLGGSSGSDTPSGESAGIRLHVPGPAPPGVFRLTAEQEGTQPPQWVELGTIRPTETETWIPLDLAELPLGPTTIHLRYVVDGDVLLDETRAIVVGRVTLEFSPVAFDRAQGVLRSTVRLASASTLTGPGSQPEIDLEVRAAFSELVWDGSARTYREVRRPAQAASSSTEVAPGSEVVLRTTVEWSAGGEAVIPLEVPLPFRPASPGVWKVTFRATVQPEVTTAVYGEERLFSTFLPAEFQTGVGAGEGFAIAVLPDTQYYAQDYPDIFTRQTHWIAQHAHDERIALVLHLGDITNNNSAVQWENAFRSMSLLQGVVPYVLALGNHDMVGRDGVDRDATLFNQYFTAEYFQPHLGGSFEPIRLENSYHLFRVGDADYLVLVLEFTPRDEVLEWANGVVAAHPQHKVIVITHTYTGPDGRRMAQDATRRSYETDEEREHPILATSMNDGEAVWQEFVRKHSNILLVISGHRGVSTIPYNVAIGDHGNRVYELLADYQWEPEGGSGYLVVLRFSGDGTIAVQGYSPYLDAYKQDRDSYGFDNDFVIDVGAGVVR